MLNQYAVQRESKMTLTIQLYWANPKRGKTTKSLNSESDIEVY